MESDLQQVSNLERTTILFVFHDAERTGASVALLNYVEWLHLNGKFNLAFLLCRQGPLSAVLSRLGPVLYSTSTSQLFVTKRVARWKRIFGPPAQPQVVQKLLALNIKLVVANTATTIGLISVLKDRLRVPALVYFHELELALKTFDIALEPAKTGIDLWIANSEATQRYLRRRLGLHEQKCVVHYPPVVIKQNLTSAGPSWPGKFVVGTSGTVIARKGYDLFIQLAMQLLKREPSRFQFVWVGCDRYLRPEVEYDLQRTGLAERIHFTGHVEEPGSVYKAFDLFVSTSKEESFGLACLELASLGKPVIGFEGTGGLEEILRDIGAPLVPYADVTSMADLIVELTHDPARMVSLGRAAQSHAKKFSSDALFQSFEKTLANLALK